MSQTQPHLRAVPPGQIAEAVAKQAAAPVNDIHAQVARELELRSDLPTQREVRMRNALREDVDSITDLIENLEAARSVKTLQIEERRRGEVVGLQEKIDQYQKMIVQLQDQIERAEKRAETAAAEIEKVHAAQMASAKRMLATAQRAVSDLAKPAEDEIVF